MSTIAYGLRADYEGTVEQDGATVPRFLGGVIAVADRPAIDLRLALEAGAGTIVVDELDTAAILALDASPALKRLPSRAAPDAPTVSRYAEVNVADLRTELGRRDLDTAGRRDELVARLEAADNIVADGGDPAGQVIADAGVAGSTGTPADTDSKD